ncbi:MAG: hypothetical protein HUJ90_07365 [Bacteroidales bacterium]|nr:hypothetical protein [Bacteroidales bacterium]
MDSSLTLQNDSGCHPDGSVATEGSNFACVDSSLTLQNDKGGVQNGEMQ